jgi:regulatory protein
MGGAARPGLSLKGQALQWLSQREHSRAEMRRKLLAQARALAMRSQGPLRAAAELRAELHPDTAAEPPTDACEEAPTDLQTQVDAVLDWLAAHRYLSEVRFVESRVLARADRFGNQRIRQELAQHGLELPADAAQLLKDSELARARAVWERKFAVAPASPGERARQQRFLAGRGFSAEVIHQLLRALRPVRSDAGEAAEPEP